VFEYKLEAQVYQYVSLKMVPADSKLTFFQQAPTTLFRDFHVFK